MTTTLEATEIRKDIYTACVQHGEACTGCPFRYTCEGHFPYEPCGRGYKDLVPADYALSDDGTMFVAEV